MSGGITSEYYDRQGRPLDMDGYIELCKEVDRQEYKRIGLDVVEADGVTWTVSTVWLGLNHSWDEVSAPLIFETMGWFDITPIKMKDKYPSLFDGSMEGFNYSNPEWGEREETHEFGDWQFRWATEPRALQGHKEVIAWLLKEGPEPRGDYGMSYEQWLHETQSTRSSS